MLYHHNFCFPLEMKNHNPVHVIMFLVLVLTSIQLAKARDNDDVTPVDVGVILDMDTSVGKISTRCMQMAISDFYAIHDNYKTRLVLHSRDSKLDIIFAAFAAMDLLESSKVQAIIGPQKSEHTEFIADLGYKVHIPIISFSATIPSIYSRSPYFVRTAPDDQSQVKAIASITQAFEWRKVILIHEDSNYGNRLVPDLINAFQDVNTRIIYRSFISPSATEDQIVEELQKLKIMQTSVFIVHMSAPFGVKFFLKAKDLGMMNEGYVWILTSGLMNVLDILEPTVLDSMQGALGVVPHIARSEKLDNFNTRWKRESFIGKEMINFGLWAYDTIWALAMAAERVGDMKPNSLRLEADGNFTDVLGMGVSQTGPKLLEEILKIKFEGLSGEFHLVNGQLQPSAFRILNVVGKGGRDVGFWTSKHGISRDLMNLNSEGPYSTSAEHFRVIIWPGESTTVPKGWAIPMNGKKLRIGVPVPEGFSELVNVEKDPYTNSTRVSGYCIDLFKSAIESLPYSLPYEFVPFQREDGRSAGSYNDLIYQVHLKNYDAVVGDITITANRSLYVDFAFPYTDGGVWMVVPLKQHEETKTTWMFFQPLTREIWIIGTVFFIFTGFLVWILEHGVGYNFRSASFYDPVRKILSFTLPTIAPYRKKLSTILSTLMVILWLFLILGLTSHYVVSLTSMLTVERLEPTITDFNDLIRNGDFVGYRKGTFIVDLLKRFHFDESKLRSYSSPEECHELLSAGSQNGGVAAVFDEMPYINIFLAKYCSKYTTVGPTHKTDGFGFVFPIGSPLVSDISKAVLKVTEGNRFLDIDRAWFRPNTTCEEDQWTIFTSTYPSNILRILICAIVLFLVVASSMFKIKQS
ncbi:hypothetical protein IFM89_004312 [Coptis chinensis]|uniref:Glutamate receptor n=1 Tax=Coptis chinensis TaxID=261450 RepID=A0A835M6V9_9MAGN|nr:hypothetical protein IFM89_004312 [Coptis chinensis]